jgi:sec-independent protein translocase protein TatA
MLAIMGIGPQEMLILGVIVLLLFGSRLPSAMRSLGSSFNSFKKGLKEGEEEERKRLDSTEDK